MQQCVHAHIFTNAHGALCSWNMHVHMHACSSTGLHAAVCAPMHVPTAVGVHADLCVRVQQCVSMQRCMHTALHACMRIYKRTQPSVLMQLVHTHA